MLGAWDTGEVHTGFGGETWWKEQLGRRRRRWEDNIKMDLQDVWEAGIGLIWRRIRTGDGRL